jgi:Bardet-Biedl syndrome 1 protein
MHNTFQRDLCRLKLEVARAYAKAVSSSLAPIVNLKDVSLKISAQVQGLGPLFQLTLAVQSTAPSAILTNLCITFKCDESLYRINKKLIIISKVYRLMGQLIRSLLLL